MMTTLLILSVYTLCFLKAYGVLRFLCATSRQRKSKLSDKCVANSSVELYPPSRI